MSKDRLASYPTAKNTNHPRPAEEPDYEQIALWPGWVAAPRPPLDIPTPPSQAPTFFQRLNSPTFQAVPRAQRVAWHDFQLAVQVLTRFFNLKTTFMIRAQSFSNEMWFLRLHTDPLITMTALTLDGDEKQPLRHILEKYQPHHALLGEVTELLLDHDLLAAKLRIHLDESSFSWWLSGRACSPPRLPIVFRDGDHGRAPRHAADSPAPAAHESASDQEPGVPAVFEIQVMQPLDHIDAGRFRTSFARVAGCHPAEIQVEAVVKMKSVMAILITLPNQHDGERLLHHAQKFEARLADHLNIIPFKRLGHPRQQFWESLTKHPPYEENGFFYPSISLSLDIPN